MLGLYLPSLSFESTTLPNNLSYVTLGSPCARAPLELVASVPAMQRVLCNSPMALACNLVCKSSAYSGYSIPVPHFRVLWNKNPLLRL
jgi:hypothetical protein